MQRRGKALLDSLASAFASSISPTGDALPTPLSKSDKAFISSILSSGTAADRLSAIVLLIQSSPLHATTYLNQLLTMCSKKSREESLKAVRSVVEWLSGSGLPANRKLKSFLDQRAGIRALYHATRGSKKRKKAGAEPLKDEDVNERKAGDDWLALWAFEDWLKTWYLSFLRAVETLAHDTLPFIRHQMIGHLAVLLRDRPEQEHNLLRLLSAKLGDPDRSVASKVSDRLLDVLSRHSAMKTVVASEVSALLLAPSTSAGFTHARYYGLVTLNQIQLTRGADQDVAAKLLDTYFESLNDVLAADKARMDKDAAEAKKAFKGSKGKAPAVTQAEGETDNKLLAAVLTGINRAFPYTTLEGDALLKRMDTLFRIAHTGSFNVSIQALIFLHHVVASARSGADALAARFYRTLYDSLLDPRLASSSKQALYLNLLFKAVRDDSSTARQAAFVKRLVQVLASHQPAFICGALHLLGEVIAASPALRNLITEPEDDDGEEHFKDVQDGEEDAESDKESIAAATSSYDPRKREPLYAQAQAACLWELIPLTNHYHPAVALHATELLLGQRPSTGADLEQHTIMRFLDRFAYRDARTAKTAVKGPSAMQPAVANVDPGSVRLRKGTAPTTKEVVNSEAFWSKDVSQIPVDQIFFHRYFSRKAKDQKEKEGKKLRRKKTRSEIGDAVEDDEASEAGSLDEDEVFEAMIRSRGQLDGADQAMFDDEIEEDEDVSEAGFAYSDDEPPAEAEDEGDFSAFDEDEEDLESLDGEEPSLFPDEQPAEQPLTADEVVKLVSQPAKTSKARRDKKRQIRQLGVFADSADWAEVLERLPSDEL